MAAAEGLAEMPGTVAVGVAEDLAAGSTGDRRVGAVLLANAEGEQAVSILADLSLDEDPFVAAQSFERLIALAPEESLAAANRWRRRGDVRLRRLAVKAFGRNPAPTSVDALGECLADVHPEVRTAAADLLAQWGARESLQVAVEQLTDRYLTGDASSLATEQAALIAAAIGRSESLSRLIELLRHESDQVAAAAAWAIGELAHRETGPAVLAEIQRETLRTEQLVEELAPVYASAPDSQVELPDLTGAYEKLEHLILALGRMRYADAAGVLQKYIAKPIPQVRGEPPPLETYKQDRLRAAAVWSLGHLYPSEAEEPSPELVAGLTARVADATPIPAESKLVRQMAAVSLGRMGRQESLDVLRAHFDPAAAHIDVGRACGWAIGQLTGEEPSRQTTQEIRYIDWFLIPTTP